MTTIKTVRLGYDIGLWSDYDWEPAPRAPRIHFPNRVRAHRQGIQIAREEIAYFRQRLDAIGKEIQAEQSLAQFRQEFDRLQAKVRAVLGITI